MEYNDYELVSLAKEKNEEAINILYNKYKPIIIITQVITLDAFSVIFTSNLLYQKRKVIS